MHSSLHVIQKSHNLIAYLLPWESRSFVYCLWAWSIEQLCWWLVLWFSLSVGSLWNGLVLLMSHRTSLFYSQQLKKETMTVALCLPWICFFSVWMNLDKLHFNKHTWSLHWAQRLSITSSTHPTSMACFLR